MGFNIFYFWKKKLILWLICPRLLHFPLLTMQRGAKEIPDNGRWRPYAFKVRRPLVLSNGFSSFYWVTSIKWLFRKKETSSTQHGWFVPWHSNWSRQMKFSRWFYSGNGNAVYIWAIYDTIEAICYKNRYTERYQSCLSSTFLMLLNATRTL